MKIFPFAMTDNQINYATALALGHHIAVTNHKYFNIYDGGDTHSIPNYCEHLPEHPVLDEITNTSGPMGRRAVLKLFVSKVLGTPIDIPDALQ